MSEDEVRRLIHAELDGEISAEQEAELQQLLSENPAWAQLYENEKAMKALFVADRQSIAAPDGLAREIADTVLTASSKTRVLDFGQLLRPLAAAAGILFLVAVSFVGGRVSTKADEDGKTGAGLLQKKQVLLEKYPKLDPIQVENLFEDCLRELGVIRKTNDKNRAKTFGELEGAIDRLILKAKNR